MYELVETPHSPDIKSRLFLTDDPALVVLYEQLRQKTLQTLRGAAKITPKVEWEFVLHSAKLYDRMGCDLLGLSLGEPRRILRRIVTRLTISVRNWEFQKSSKPDFGGDVNPLSLLKRRSSLVVDDLPMRGPTKDAPRDGLKKGVTAPPTQFQEPDASSLLDSFGF